jgi:hypothetical protein
MLVDKLLLIDSMQTPQLLCIVTEKGGVAK